VRYTWREAHRITQIAAAHSHHDLGINRDRYVDVFNAIRMLDIPLQLAHMPNLFGIYVCPTSDGPGILLNSGLHPTALRHTAAHELGHHHFRHGNSIDRLLDPWDGLASRGWSGPEMIAEAFAAWFLMPRPAVLAALAILGRDRPRAAEDVYRLATLLGVSFRGLARHLVNLNLACNADAQAWARTGRGALRHRLAGAAADQCRGEVHLLRPEMGDLTIHVWPDDLLVLPRGRTRHSLLTDCMGRLEPVSTPADIQLRLETPDQKETTCWRVTPGLTEPATVCVSGTSDSIRDSSVRVQPVQVREGIDLPWLEAHQDHRYSGEDTVAW
jgi:Zn-dependent peptidase ImmA (M78 family)